MQWNGTWEFVHGIFILKSGPGPVPYFLQPIDLLSPPHRVMAQDNDHRLQQSVALSEFVALLSTMQVHTLLKRNPAFSSSGLFVPADIKPLIAPEPGSYTGKPAGISKNLIKYYRV